MAKRCPSCGYGPIGFFVDHCPMCAAQVAGGIGWSAGFQTLPVWGRWFVGGTAAAVLAVGVYWGLGGPRPAPQVAVEDVNQAVERAKAYVEADRRTRTVVVDAKQLLQEFQADPAAADRKYRHKYLELTGVVERTGTVRDDFPFIILHAGDEDSKVKIECLVRAADDADRARIQQLARGQTITVRGEYSGQVSHIQVQDCVLGQ